MPELPPAHPNYNIDAPFGYPKAIIEAAASANDPIIGLFGTYALRSEIDVYSPGVRCCHYWGNCTNPVHHVINAIKHHKKTYDFNTRKFIAIPEGLPTVARDAMVVCATRTGDTKCKYCNSTVTPGIRKLLDSVGSEYKNYCLNCIGDNSFTCFSCGEDGKKSTCLAVQDLGSVAVYLCRTCYNERLRNCGSCGRSTWKEWIDDGLCSPCQAKVIQEYNFKPTPKFLVVGPEPKPGYYFGMELEVEMRRKYADFKEIVAYRFNKDIKSIAYLKSDSSISNGFEIVTHPGSFEWWNSKDNPLIAPIKRLTRTCESFKRESTGIHIHVSRTAFGSSFHLAKFVKFFYMNPQLCAFVAERYQASQAGYNTGISDKIVQLVTGRLKQDRHTIVNLTTNRQVTIDGQTTVEIRMFKGNMKWERILKNIQFIDAVVTLTGDSNTGGSKLGIANLTEEMVNKQSDNLTASKFIEFINKSDRWPELKAFLSNYKRKS